MDPVSTPLRETYRSLVDLVTATLRHQILDHTLKPNEWLRQDQLAARLGVSRMPVRDALRRLEVEGLVAISARGAIVADLSPEVISENYAIRAALEGLAARRGAARIGPEGLAELAEVLDEMRRAHEAGHHVGVLEQVSRFRETLYACSGMPSLCAMIRTLRARCEHYRRATMSVPGRSARSVEVHEEMLRACQAGDAAEVERLAQQALQEYEVVLLRYVSGNGRGPES
ncbi:MAG: GntR family transcriptional regulator [Chloroflexi bacterium]|nr:GntR family transcriptional regulator [Chloroflexota bacterium]